MTARGVEEGRAREMATAFFDRQIDRTGLDTRQVMFGYLVGIIAVALESRSAPAAAPAAVDAPTESREARLGVEAATELCRAVAKHAPFNSLHEGYGVILEELDEFWDEVRAWQPTTRDYTKARKEAIQVAAMALRVVLDICDREPTPPVEAQPGALPVIVANLLGWYKAECERLHDALEALLDIVERKTTLEYDDAAIIARARTALEFHPEPLARPSAAPPRGQP